MGFVTDAERLTLPLIVLSELAGKLPVAPASTAMIGTSTTAFTFPGRCVSFCVANPTGFGPEL